MERGQRRQTCFLSLFFLSPGEENDVRNLFNSLINSESSLLKNKASFSGFELVDHMVPYLQENSPNCKTVNKIKCCILVQGSKLCVKSKSSAWLQTYNMCNKTFIISCPSFFRNIKCSFTGNLTLRQAVLQGTLCHIDRNRRGGEG